MYNVFNPNNKVQGTEIDEVSTSYTKNLLNVPH